MSLRISARAEGYISDVIGGKIRYLKTRKAGGVSGTGATFRRGISVTLRFSTKQGEGIIRFIESFCHHSQGEWAGNRVTPRAVAVCNALHPLRVAPGQTLDTVDSSLHTSSLQRVTESRSSLLQSAYTSLLAVANPARKFTALQRRKSRRDCLLRSGAHGCCIAFAEVSHQVVQRQLAHRRHGVQVPTAFLR